MSNATSELDIREQAFVMHLRGDSYKQIGDELGIGKSTAFKYVKELQKRNAGKENEEPEQQPAQMQTAAKEQSGAQEKEQSIAASPSHVSPIFKKSFEQVVTEYEQRFGKLSPKQADEHPEKGNHTLPATAVSASISTASSGKPFHSDKLPLPKQADKPVEKQKANDKAAPAPDKSEQPKPAAATLPVPKPAPKKIKEFTGDELVAKHFECLPFTGRFRELIGTPSKLFAGLIWGLPKGGKSNFSIRFADYLQEYFGKVVYIAAEEGESVTLQEKFKDIGGSKVTVVETRDRDVIRDYLSKKGCDFVFIDSINNAGIDNEFLELLKTENPTKSFIGIVQATKGGNFKGDQALTHNCDFIIKVVDGIAYHHGRFNVASEISIFEEPLYEKNAEQQSGHYPASAGNNEAPQWEGNEYNRIGEDVTASAATVATGMSGEYSDETDKTAQPVGTENIQNPLAQVATLAGSSNDQRSVVTASNESTTSIFGPPSPAMPVPVKAVLTNPPVSTNSSGSHSSYSGSSLGRTSSYTTSALSTSASATGKGKSKKAKKKTGISLGDAALAFGGGFIGGYVYYDYKERLAKKAAAAAAAAATKAQPSPALAGNRNPGAAQQAKSLQPVARANQVGATSTQPQQVPDRRLIAQQQRSIQQQPLPGARPQPPVSVATKTPIKAKTLDEVCWDLDGLDMLL